LWGCNLDHAEDIQEKFPVIQTAFAILSDKFSRKLPDPGTAMRVVEMTSIPYRRVSWSVVTVKP
jgi:hypothetical protein